MPSTPDDFLILLRIDGCLFGGVESRSLGPPVQDGSAVDGAVDAKGLGSIIQVRGKSSDRLRSQERPVFVCWEIVVGMGSASIP